jgi:glutathione S-transferase
MKLFFAPMACSLASRIALYETGTTAEYVFVDIHTDPVRRTLQDGTDYRLINPMGQVPALETDAGEIITENPVVLQYLVDHVGHAKLGDAAGIGRYRLQEWLNFLATELHKATFIPLLIAMAMRPSRSGRATGCPCGSATSTDVSRAAAICWTDSLSRTPTWSRC